MSKTATLVKDRLDWGTDAKLYRLDPPLSSEPWGDEEPRTYEYVAVSAAAVPYSGPETYIFGANAEGKVIDWSELPGSLRGGWDHEAALRGAGYEVSR